MSHARPAEQDSGTRDTAPRTHTHSVTAWSTSESEWMATMTDHEVTLCDSCGLRVARGVRTAIAGVWCECQRSPLQVDLANYVKLSERYKEVERERDELRAALDHADREHVADQRAISELMNDIDELRILLRYALSYVPDARAANGEWLSPLRPKIEEALRA